LAFFLYLARRGTVVDRASGGEATGARGGGWEAGTSETRLEEVSWKNDDLRKKMNMRR